jgi:hypothetical protein
MAVRTGVARIAHQKPMHPPHSYTLYAGSQRLLEPTRVIGEQNRNGIYTSNWLVVCEDPERASQLTTPIDRTVVTQQKPLIMDDIRFPVGTSADLRYLAHQLLPSLDNTVFWAYDLIMDGVVFRLDRKMNKDSNPKIYAYTLLTEGSLEHHNSLLYRQGGGYSDNTPIRPSS